LAPFLVAITKVEPNAFVKAKKDRGSFRDRSFANTHSNFQKRKLAGMAAE